MKGCEGPSEHPYIFPPSPAMGGPGPDLYEGEQIQINVCPVRVCTPDVMRVLDDYNLTDGRLTLSEKDSLPTPYLKAYRLVSYHLPKARAWRARLERKK